MLVDHALSDEQQTKKPRGVSLFGLTLSLPSQQMIPEITGQNCMAHVTKSDHALI